ncbi:apolipoprotein L3-like [Sorex fumeus]|uniref:apolipoprotein L3-like n=1 Tax=Sorex fumeus TaxID=62283 RepID=UPI0024AE3CC9|nr:apolipoprotein L3-like [Sorex fumeus]XP_055993517.1 apolipoprotein L3-like [Sorex fumeus]
MDPEILQCLLKDNAWEAFMEEIELSREEGEVLRESLRKHKILIALEGSEDHHQKQKVKNAVLFFLLVLFLFCYYQYCTLANMSIIALTGLFWVYSYHTSPPSEIAILREKILKVFPEVRVKLSKRITLLRELADRSDQVHKACTVANVVASSAGLASSIVSLVGLGLAPVTGGLSVDLSTMALGLGAIATATTVTTSAVEQTNMSSITAKARAMKTMGSDPLLVTVGVLHQNQRRLFSLCSNFTSLKRVWRHVLATQNSTPKSSFAHRLLGNTAKTMTRTEKIMSGAASGFCALMDAYDLRQASKHLKEGAKTEEAEILRLWTRELEGIRELVAEIQGSLLKISAYPE